MILTHQNIHALFNCGCPNSPQMAILGVPYPLPSGWIRRLIGRTVPDETYAKLMELKGPRPKGMPTKDWRAGNTKPAPSFDRKALRDQFKRLLLCLRAGENIAAQDHAREIQRLCVATSAP